MESFLTVRGDFILSGKDQLTELPFFTGLGLGEDGSETPSSVSFAAARIPGPAKRGLAPALSSSANPPCVSGPHICLHRCTHSGQEMESAGLASLDCAVCEVWTLSAGSEALTSPGCCSVSFRSLPDNPLEGTAGGLRRAEPASPKLKDWGAAESSSSGMGLYHISPSSSASLPSLKSKEQVPDNDQFGALHTPRVHESSAALSKGRER